MAEYLKLFVSGTFIFVPILLFVLIISKKINKKFIYLKQMLLVKLKQFYIWYCYGKIIERVVDRVNGIPCEIAYYNIEGDIVGFWAYGYWQPDLPYKG
jgi:hypothetical protein